MGSELPPPPPAAAAPAVKPPSIPSAATTTTATHASAAEGTTTISSLGQDQLLEIFLRLPNLPALVRAALTCRSWLGVVRSSPPFRRLFRELHPAPLLGLFLEVDDDTAPSFAHLRRTDPDVAAALGHGDFFLTSLPAQDGAHTGWGIMDCRDGYILLWNMMSVAAVNPMTWAVDIIPLPQDATEGCLRDFACLGFHLLSSEENPWSFRVVCVCADVSRVRAAVFSSETRGWVVHSWMEIDGEFNMMDSAATLVGGSIYQPLYGEGRAIRIDTATMDVSSLYLPSLATDGDSMVGDTEDGKLCMVYASTDDLLLHVWIRSGDGDGIESWVLQDIISLRAEIDGEWQDQVTIVEVRSGRVYFSMTCITDGTEDSWFFYLSIKTMEIELLMQGMSHDNAYPYTMAWPPCLIGDDRSTEHEVRGCLLKSSNSTKLTEQVQALQRDNEILKTSLNKAEEEVKLLFKENRALDEANKRLLCLLEKEQKHRSERKHSASNPTKKCKSSSPVGLAIDFNSADASRQPLQPNSPDRRVHKK